MLELVTAGEKKVSHENELECELEKNTHPDLIEVSYWFKKKLIEEYKVTLAYNEAKYYKKRQGSGLHILYVLVYYLDKTFY